MDQGQIEHLTVFKSFSNDYITQPLVVLAWKWVQGFRLYAQKLVNYVNQNSNIANFNPAQLSSWPHATIFH